MRLPSGRRHTSSIATILMVCIAMAVLATACVTPATEALIAVGTDIPSDRVVVVTVSVADPQAHVSMQGHWSFDAGRSSPSSARMASFAVVPGHGARDAAVTVTLDAVILPLSPRDTPVTLRRRIGFRFIPGRAIVIPVFLSAQCLRPAAGCTSVPPAQCNRSVLCEDLGRTCGDQGECVSPLSQMDAGADATTDALIDAGAFPESCTPLCTGRNCGDDECGGSCGVCTGGTSCDTLTGHCVCVPACAGRDCGDDGCGGSCGSCPANQACAGAHCAFTCSGPGQSCCTSGLACQAGLMCSGGQCVGACGSAGAPCCGGSSCNTPLVCMGGSCQPCASGTSACGGSCVDLGSDASNCGACGRACATGMTCCNASCVSIYTDDANCGTCGHVCGPGTVCYAASCSVCGGLYQNCCAGMACNTGFGCFFDPPAGMSCQPCGREGQSCCPGDTCLSGFTCNSTRTDIRLGCILCGGGGQPCCNGTTCTSGYSCTTVIAGVTTLCTTPTTGLPGSSCASDADCSGSSFCRNNYCYVCGPFDYFCCPNAPGGMCNAPYACHQLGTTTNYSCW